MDTFSLGSPTGARDDGFKLAQNTEIMDEYVDFTPKLLCFVVEKYIKRKTTILHAVLVSYCAKTHVT